MPKTLPKLRHVIINRPAGVSEAKAIGNAIVKALVAKWAREGKANQLEALSDEGFCQPDHTGESEVVP